jgi:hypothetical protein
MGGAAYAAFQETKIKGCKWTVAKFFVVSLAYTSGTIFLVVLSMFRNGLISRDTSWKSKVACLFCSVARSVERARLLP